MDSAATCHHCEIIRIEDNWNGHKGTTQELSYRECVELFHMDCSTCPPEKDQVLLCTTCKHLKLRHLLFCHRAWWNIPVGALENMEAVQDCAFHRLLLLAAQAFIETLKIPDHVAKTLPFRLSAFLRRPNDTMTNLSLEVVQEGFDHPSNTLLVHCITEELEASLSPQQCFVPSRIDFEQLKSLINSCTNSHSHHDSRIGSDESIGVLPRNFRVIDVQERRLTALPATARFVALSYVWGTQPLGSESISRLSNIATYEMAGGLSAAILPNVIEEALQVCLRLNERYIWVDRFCIVQDDCRGKSEHIQSMADIFIMATFTLVIACGNDMGVQLPGLSISRPVSTGCADFDGLHVRSRLPCLLDSIRASRWYTRGWTYQEGVLATRKLFITPTQAMWMCPDEVVHEEASMNKTYGLHDFLNYRACQKEFQVRGPELSQFEAYVAHSSLYNERILSYPEDIYEAFSGIGKVLYGSWDLFDDHVYGLPIADFDAALLWYPADSHQSKVRTSDQVNLPDWSWSSVPGALRYLPFSGSLIRWQLRASDHDGQVMHRTLNAFQCSSFLLTSRPSSLSNFRTWHQSRRPSDDQQDETISYYQSPCYFMVLALSRDCMESILCDNMREMLEDLSATEFNEKIQLRWPDYSYYYAEAFWHESATVMEKPVPGPRLLTLETRAQVASVRVSQHGPHDVKRCRLTTNDSWWNVLAPNKMPIGLMRPVPLLSGPLSNGQGGTRRITVIAISVGILDWWREDCLEFHKDTDEKYGPLAEEHCTEPQAHTRPGDKICNFEHRGPPGLLPPLPAINVMLIIWTEPVWRRVSVGCILLDDWAKLDRHFEDIQLC